MTGLPWEIFGTMRLIRNFLTLIAWIKNLFYVHTYGKTSMKYYNIKGGQKKIFRYQFFNTIDMFKNPYSENKLKTYRIVVCSSSEFHWTLDIEKCLTEFECTRWTVLVRTDRLDPVDTDPGVFGRQAERGPGRAHCVRLPFLLSLLLRWYVPECVIVFRLFWVII